MTAVVTGAAVAGTGLIDVADLLGSGPIGTRPCDPAEIVGRKGLRYKDEATRLALAAAHLALADAGLPVVPSGDGGRTGVVVSSNLGNLDTVCAASDTITAEGVTALSPMALPNASSNVVASTLAIRFGLRGPNLTVCNGATSGLDALHWASVLIAGGRADRVLVVGVEVDNDTVSRLCGPEPLFHGAAAVVVERATSLGGRGVGAGPAIAGYRRAAGVLPTADRVATRQVGLWLAPATPDDQRPSALDAAAVVVDLVPRLGRASGALGVLQCAAASAYLAGGGRTVLATAGSDADDASASMLFTHSTGEH